VSSTEYIDDRLPANGKNVAVVVGGPAGISAAYYLVKSGYVVTLMAMVNRCDNRESSSRDSYRHMHRVQLIGMRPKCWAG